MIQAEPLVFQTNVEEVRKLKIMSTELSFLNRLSYDSTNESSLKFNGLISDSEGNFLGSRS